MSKQSKHGLAILELVSAQDNLTTGDIAEALGLSLSRTRELLAIEIKAGTLDRAHQEVDGAKVLVYFPKAAPGSAPAPASPPADTAENLTAPKAEKTPKKGATKAKDKPTKKAKVVKAPKEKKPRRKASGVGKPNAKKVVNPQQTLDLKKAMVERNKGKMVWANRIWTITVKGESTSFRSRELAALTLEALAKQLGLTV